MSYIDAEIFMVDESTFPTDTMQCCYHLEEHSVMVDLMMGEAAPFAVAYQQCVQDLCSHFDLSLRVHYGELGGGAYQVGLCILLVLDDAAVPVLVPLQKEVWLGPAFAQLPRTPPPCAHQDPAPPCFLA